MEPRYRPFMGHSSPGPTALEPAARTGAFARAGVRHDRRRRPDAALLGRARAGGSYLQRREDVSRAAGRRRPRSRTPAGRRGTGRRPCPRYRLRCGPQRARDLGASAPADQRVGGRVLRRARPGRSLPYGAVSGRPGGRQERRSPPPRSAGHPLGIQRRAHQPAVARPAALVRATAARGFSRQHHATDRRQRARGGGRGTTTRGSSSPGGGFNRFRAARIGEAGCRSAASIRRASAGCSWTTAGSTAVRWSRGSGSSACDHRARSHRSTGICTWLNHARRVFPSAPASSYFAIGAGSSFTWIEPERRMVLVVRWIDADYADGFFGRVLQALDSSMR